MCAHDGRRLNDQLQELCRGAAPSHCVVASGCHLCDYCVAPAAHFVPTPSTRSDPPTATNGARHSHAHAHAVVTLVTVPAPVPSSL